MFPPRSLSVTKKNPSAVSVKGSTRSRPPSPVRWMSPASLTTSFPLPGSRARPEESPKAFEPVSSTTPTTASLAVSRTTRRLRPAGAKRRVRSRRSRLTNRRSPTNAVWSISGRPSASPQGERSTVARRKLAHEAEPQAAALGAARGGVAHCGARAGAPARAHPHRHLGRADRWRGEHRERLRERRRAGAAHAHAARRRLQAEGHAERARAVGGAVAVAACVTVLADGASARVASRHAPREESIGGGAGRREREEDGGQEEPERAQGPPPPSPYDTVANSARPGSGKPSAPRVRSSPASLASSARRTPASGSTSSSPTSCRTRLPTCRTLARSRKLSAMMLAS